ncbi:sugar isomerase, KpsF/GutQ family [Leptospira wolbachii serovar Codice str. CDC]|uniref:Sugar isomerase, KpsF/GutQ family n=1 Tax=Leptospira wolbachii serovar Codice str. CDC TaxID=1218599 RepID=R9A522_9LEPT|nr:KpsF/GutQ family sugar-phosphate isomerase [Leptospira wolbachii]EOQ95340.1 sugar isomerase, KpsF/GutQ family [Leptospira wolbachii serovar Codice str. CDC]
MKEKDTLSIVKQALDDEISSLVHFRDQLDPSVKDCIDLILNSSGKVIVTGVGKSGDIAKKISHTLSSTGTSAYFLHPTDASHGDSGIVGPDDVVLAIGKSGESEELNYILPTLRKIGAKIVGITANAKSKLAALSDIVIITPVLKEACPLDLAPTSSTTIALVLGDAIAVALMELKNFQANDFALYHPAGRLGKRLSLYLSDVMRKGERNASISVNANLETILKEITEKGIGATGVVDSESKLIGLITDYDIRKYLTKKTLLPTVTAKDMMNANPSSFRPEEKAYDVLIKMEGRDRPISVAPVVDETGQFVGMISLHDLLQKGL